MIEIAYPWMLVSVILPWLVRKFIRREERRDSALRIPFFSELALAFKQPSLNSQTRWSMSHYMFLLIWLLMVISTLGIQWVGQPVASPQNGRDIMLAVDLSGSMKTPDMMINGQQRTRLFVVKNVAEQFIRQRKGDQIGLVLFGTKPYLQAPLTFDRKTVEEMLNEATIGLAGEQTAIGDAIGLAVKKLMHAPKKSKALILMTDGANDAGNLVPLQAAKLAKEEGVKIYTIGLGGGKITVQTFLGPQTINTSTDLDVSSLKKIAQLTGGKFFRAEGGQSLEKIYHEINQLEPVAGKKTVLRPIMPIYPWTLGLALIFSFIMSSVSLIRHYRMV